MRPRVRPVAQVTNHRAGEARLECLAYRSRTTLPSASARGLDAAFTNRYSPKRARNSRCSSFSDIGQHQLQIPISDLNRTTASSHARSRRPIDGYSNCTPCASRPRNEDVESSMATASWSRFAPASCPSLTSGPLASSRQTNAVNMKSPNSTLHPLDYVQRKHDRSRRHS